MGDVGAEIIANSIEGSFSGGREEIIAVPAGVAGVVGDIPDDELRLGQASLESDALFKTLPAQQLPEVSQVVNYLGSSYSGVDIKVVAHLYDTVQDRDAKIAALEQEKQTAKFIEDGVTTLLQGGLSALQQQQVQGGPFFWGDFSSKRELFIAATGLNETDPTMSQAVKILVSNVFKEGNYTPLGIAKMTRSATTLQQAYKGLATNLANKLVNLIQLEQSSLATVTLGSLQTISVQTHREKFAVRALGHGYAKAYTRGPRTIAGSMIFTIFDEHALSALIRSMSQSPHFTGGERDTELATLLPDQLPPIDLSIVFANEYGSLSDFRIYGVEFINDGSTFSIEDLMSEQIINFVCRDADVMTKRGKIKLSRLQRGMFSDRDDKDIDGSSLIIGNNDYNKYLDRLRVRRRLKNR